MPKGKTRVTKTTGTYGTCNGEPLAVPKPERTAAEITHESGLDERAFAVRKPETIKRGVAALKNWGR